MDHSTMKDKLYALYDGELDAAERREVETHMAGCTGCRQFYERWAKTAQACFKAPKVSVSEFFVTSVMNRIHALEVPRPAFRWGLQLGWLVPALGVAIVLLALMLPAPEVVTMDALLSQETGSRTSWLFSNHAPSSDETLQFVMEG